MHRHSPLRVDAKGRLKIVDRELTDEVTGIIVNALQHDATLCDIALIGVDCDSPGGSGRLERVLLAARGSSLKRLSIIDASMTHGMLETLNVALRATKISAFTIAGTNLSVGCDSVASIVGHSLTLRSLTFSDVSASPTGLMMVARQLNHGVIAEIDLSYNPEIGKAVLGQVIEFLPTGTLRRLDLSGTRLGDKQFHALCGMLIRCALLEELCVGDNSLSQISFDRLTDVMRACPRLRVIDFSGNNVHSLAHMTAYMGSASVARLHSMYLHDNPSISDTDLLSFMLRVLVPHRNTIRDFTIASRKIGLPNAEYADDLIANAGRADGE